MSQTTIEKSTLPNTINEIKVSTTFQTIIVNNNTQYDEIDDYKKEY